MNFQRLATTQNCFVSKHSYASGLLYDYVVAEGDWVIFTLLKNGDGLLKAV